MPFFGRPQTVKVRMHFNNVTEPCGICRVICAQPVCARLLRAVEAVLIQAMLGSALRTSLMDALHLQHHQVRLCAHDPRR